MPSVLLTKPGPVKIPHLIAWIRHRASCNAGTSAGGFKGYASCWDCVTCYHERISLYKHMLCTAALIHAAPRPGATVEGEGEKSGNVQTCISRMCLST